MVNNELCHYGVLGMKWGVRRTPEQLARARKSLGFAGRTTVKAVAKVNKAVSKIQSKQAESYKKDIDSLKSNREEMLSLKAKNGKNLFTEKDVDSMISVLEKKYTTIQKKSKNHERFANSLIKELDELRKRDG